MALDRNEVQKLKQAGSPEQFQLFANSQQSAQKLLNSFDKTKPLTVNGYVVFQFYPWFKFNFPLFQTHYHTLSYPKKNNI